MQLFTKCLAPNTCGDGTGCDNMTAVIIQFQKTFTERFHDTDKPIGDEVTSKTVKAEIEEEVTSKKIEAKEEVTSKKIEEEVTSKKRPISPAPKIGDADTDTSKRIKTDENHANDEINMEVK